MVGRGHNNDTARQLRMLASSLVPLMGDLVSAC